MNNDNGFGKVLIVFVNCVWLGLLWLLCSLPVVTLGAASTGIYYATVKGILRERGNPTKLFFKAFKDNFKTATVSWLIMFAFLALVVTDIFFVRSSGYAGTLLETLSWVLLVPAGFMLSWMFAYISRFENSVWGGLKFLALFSLKCLGKTILILIIFALCAVLIYLFPAFTPLLPGLVCLLLTCIIEPEFKQFTGELGQADAWYNE